MEIRKLRADEIECRIQSIYEKGLRLLLYKDARCDMRILDETFGAMNWKREHSRDNKNCTVSIWDNDKQQWVSKEDTGTESNTEAEKGLASDSFKRACTNWGIGRELYTAPDIWINAGNYRLTNGKCYDRFKVTDIAYDDSGNICRLAIKNVNSGREVYSMGNQQRPAATKAASPNARQALIDFCRETGTDMNAVQKEFKLTAKSSDDVFRKALNTVYERTINASNS